MNPTNGRLRATFSRLRESGELGLFPFLTTGFPDPDTCQRLLRAIVEAGADGVELGIPFSDPLADGVTLQRASARALEYGVTIADALALVRDLRTYSSAPAFLMSYYNPLLAYGLDDLTDDGVVAGMDGLIVPDLPVEESAELRERCTAHGLDLIQMVAPTTDDTRLGTVGATTTGFVYCVTLLGTTGARAQLSEELPGFLQRVRRAVTCPLVAGFGISTPAHVAGLAGHADGAIVGGALADLVERSDPASVISQVSDYIGGLKAATRPGRQRRTH